MLSAIRLIAKKAMGVAGIKIIHSGMRCKTDIVPTIIVTNQLIVLTDNLIFALLTITHLRKFC